MRTICCVTVGILLLCATAAAQDADEALLLRYKFEPGQELRYAVSGTGEGGFRIDGMPGAPEPGDMWMEASLTLDMATQSVDEAGIGQIRLDIADAFAKMQVFGEVVEVQFQDGRLIMTQGGEVSLDTGKPPEEGDEDDQAKQMRRLLDTFVKNGLVIRLAPDGKLVGLPQLELLGDWIKESIPGLDIKQILEQSQASLPPNRVKVGDQWEVRERMPFPGPDGGELPETVTTYTLAAVEEVEGRKCARIVATSDVDLAGVNMAPPMMGPFGPPGGNMVLEMRTANISFEGTDHFDYERGVTLSSVADIELDLIMHQEMTVATAEGETDVAFDISIRDFKLAFNASLLE